MAVDELWRWQTARDGTAGCPQAPSFRAPGEPSAPSQSLVARMELDELGSLPCLKQSAKRQSTMREMVAAATMELVL